MAAGACSKMKNIKKNYHGVSRRGIVSINHSHSFSAPLREIFSELSPCLAHIKKAAPEGAALMLNGD